MPFLKDLVLESKDGEWGGGEPSVDTTQMRVVRGTDFEAFRLGNLDHLPVRHVSERHAQRKTLSAEDIIIETAGGSKNRPTGRTVFVTADRISASDLPLIPASFARFMRINRDRVCPRFLFWKLQAMYTDGTLKKYHTQHTGVARFQFTTFSTQEEFEVPGRLVQERIAAILSAYDDLIENNMWRIAILEEMARRIFEEWFVRFRAPGVDLARLVDSPLGPIPEGWEVKTIDDITSYVNRGIAPHYSDEAQTIVINQKCIRGQRLSVEQARRQDKEVPADKLVRMHDILINSTGVGTLGRVAQVAAVPDGCTVDTHITIVRPTDDIDPHFFGLAVLRLQPIFTGAGMGSTGQTELQRDRIKAVELTMPPKALRGQFGKVIASMRRLSFLLEEQNRNLRTQRDLLLPKLISGEIDVSASADKIKEAAE